MVPNLNVHLPYFTCYHLVTNQDHESASTRGIHAPLLPPCYADHMILTEDEITEGCKRLFAATAKGNWHEQPERVQYGYRRIVVELAAQLAVDHSPSAVTAFLMWMGEPSASNAPI